MSNRRRRTRVDFSARADIHTVGAMLKSVPTRDLSHKGIFILGEHPLKPGQTCMVDLHLPGDAKSAPILHMEGQVARLTPEGTAIDFVSMDADTYLHLRNLVLLNAPDPDQAQREFAQPAFEDEEP